MEARFNFGNSVFANGLSNRHYWCNGAIILVSSADTFRKERKARYVAKPCEVKKHLFWICTTKTWSNSTNSRAKIHKNKTDYFRSFLSFPRNLILCNQRLNCEYVKVICNCGNVSSWIISWSFDWLAITWPVTTMFIYKIQNRNFEI